MRGWIEGRLTHTRGMERAKRDGTGRNGTLESLERGRGLNHGTTCSLGEFMALGFIYLFFPMLGAQAGGWCGDLQNAR